jgi:uncharacterized protein YodC (DUF2158 family)
MQEIKLGDIVALKSHPFTATNTDVIISGDAQHISPLMVVVEILIESKNIYDEQTGDLKGKKQCKCIWFSNKSSQFEEAWLSDNLLNIIASNVKKSEVEAKLEKEGFSEKEIESLMTTKKLEKFAVGETVSLKTLNFELNKKKSTLKAHGYNSKEVNISALLSFVPPTMQVIGKSKNENKEPIFDAKSSEKKRSISKNLIKCKWYNPSSDKMSEKLLPPEALQIIPPLNQELLDKIQESKYIKIKYNEVHTLIKFQSISVSSGYYLLIAFNYLSNKIEEFELDKVNYEGSIENYYISKHLDFDALGDDFTPKNIQLHQDAIIEYAIKEKKYIQIEYKNKNGGISTRTLKNFQELKVKVSETDFDTYLVGFCMTKQDNRHFKLGRIEKICVLDLSYES